MRKINTQEITDLVATLCMTANFDLPDEITEALRNSCESEESPAGKDILKQILENERIARTERSPLCQDTGTTCVYLDIGQEVQLEGAPLREAVDEGVRRGYKEGYLRKSIVRDPLIRENTGDNTPSMLHTEIVPGDKIHVDVMTKGGGCENMSGLAMLRPSDGRQGIIDFVVNKVKNAGGNPCPPLVLGVGVGGAFDLVAAIAKKALMRGVGNPNPQKHLAELEKDLLDGCNATGVGPMGLGGRTTVLSVNVEAYPTHIASLPVAMAVNCHSSRYKSGVI
ncbi:MAG: fumarate hydratase [bacterium]